MAGRIRDEDVVLVRERAPIADVIGESVQLRPAGGGRLKGLCPFHDEKTPSFTVRPAVGAWHCFGCGEGGDLISFVQRVEHLGFSEAVERLAQKLGSGSDMPAYGRDLDDGHDATPARPCPSNSNETMRPSFCGGSSGPATSRCHAPSVGSPGASSTPTRRTRGRRSAFPSSVRA